MLHRENKIKKYNATSAADVLKETMDYYDITQQDLAGRLGISQKNVSDILNRKRYITEIIALRIEKVMGISSNLLLALDASYKMQLAKESHKVEMASSKSPLFLKKYDWVSA